jgi:hypothetical protein
VKRYGCERLAAYRQVGRSTATRRKGPEIFVSLATAECVVPPPDPIAVGSLLEP